MVLSLSISVMVKSYQENYLELFHQIQLRMANMPVFPLVPGFAATRFKNGIVQLSCLILSGLSDFVSTQSKVKSFMGESSVLPVGLGYHSKDFSTLLTHFGIALMSTIDITTSTFGLAANKDPTYSVHPLDFILRVICVVVDCYINIRRTMYYSVIICDYYVL